MSGDHLDQLDYYTLLGLESDASMDAVRRAFRVFARKYHPDLYASRSPEHVERAARIYRRGTEALRVLCDLEARQRYDEGLTLGRLRFDPSLRVSRRNVSSVRGGRFGVRSTKARPFVVKAEQALQRGDRQTARLNLQIALRHEPGNEALELELRALVAASEGKDPQAT